MKKIRKTIILSLFSILIFQGIVLANSADNLLIPIKNLDNNPAKQQNSIFSLANIVDSFLKSEEKNQNEYQGDKKTIIRKKFIDTTSKFNQGNALVAYGEYEDLLEEIDDDNSLLALAKVFDEIGFFSLANKSIEKIIYKNQYYNNISDLEKNYKIKANLSKEDEIYFAKLYSDIYFNNSAQETITELLNKKQKYNKNDYYYFTLSRSFHEIKKYSDALNYINKAINLSPTNLAYQTTKIDILISSKKYCEALKLISKIQNSKNFSPYFVDILEAKKLTALAYYKDKARKTYIAQKSFEEGNFEKTKKECQNILNFDKDNYKVLTLYAKSELALGNIERANVYFTNSYKLNKKNLDTIIGIADIKYLHGDYKNSTKMYKKAYRKDKKNYEIILKLANSQRQYGASSKELRKLELKLDNMPRTSYLAYYSSAISLAQKNSVLKEDFLKRAIEINPLDENVVGELVELYLKNKNYKLARGLIYNASLTLEKNYYYYYLCGLYNQSINKKNDAIQFYKTSLNLNPNFEIANTKLLKLIPSTINEEI